VRVWETKPDHTLKSLAEVPVRQFCRSLTRMR